MGKPISTKEFCSHYGVSVMAELPEHAFIYPDFYPKGSLLWVCKRLDYLSIEDRKTASERFSSIYLQSGHVAAQNFLNDFVRANGFNVIKRQEPQPEKQHDITINKSCTHRLLIDHCDF